jgi:hypothetical protein
MAHEFASIRQVHEYARARRLEIAVEGTAAFNRRRRYLWPDRFQVVAVRTRNGGIIQVGMFKEDSETEVMAMEGKPRSSDNSPPNSAA